MKKLGSPEKKRHERAMKRRLAREEVLAHLRFKKNDGIQINIVFITTL
jgi:hypothetical protein